MISRQLAPSIRIEFHFQSVHSSLANSAISGMRTSVLRRVALVVVPDEQQTAADVGVPRLGTGQSRGALGVGHQLALAVAAPAPVVERAGDLVALDRALRQVAAHVAAVAVQHLEVAVRVGEDHQHGAEDLHAVRLAVQVILHRAEAVPAACEPVRQRAGVDFADACSFGSHGGPPVFVALTRTRYSFSLPARNLNAFYLRYI